jgi:hypothetical protein
MTTSQKVALFALSSGVVPDQKVAHAGNNLGDANGTVKNGRGVWKGNFHGARGYQDGGDTLDQILNSGVAKKLGSGFEDNDMGKPARCDSATSVVRRIHPERVDT